MSALTPLPSLWQAMRGKLLLYGVMAVLLAIVLGLENPTAGPAAAVLVFLITIFFEWRSARRLNRALAAFAREIPEPGIPSSTFQGGQSLTWPGRGIEVHGWTWRFQVQPLRVIVGEREWDAAPREAREAAREAWAEAVAQRRRRR